MPRPPEVIIYYHDPVEVDPATSWTGLCPELNLAKRIDIKGASDPRLENLFRYARPDAVITVGGNPVVSIEQTKMNPSGHNIPQRFSFHLAAGELCVPSILYYPEYSRRTLSDPNVRYLQVRVPLAQKRLSLIYKVPVLSLFWPTDPATKLPSKDQAKHFFIAETVGALIRNAGNRTKLLELPEVKKALAEMDRAVLAYSDRYKQNASVRRLMADGFHSAKMANGQSIDPPDSTTLHKTDRFLTQLRISWSRSKYPRLEDKFRARKHTLVFKGTANKHKTDSEHPWPGYLTLFDALYARKGRGQAPNARDINLVYHLPVQASSFLKRIRQNPQPTATHIVDVFSDLLILNDGIIPGKPLRGEYPPEILRR